MLSRTFNAFVIAALFLTACGGAATTTPPTSAPAGEKITLKMWSHQNTAFIQANEALIAKFEAQHPNVDVTYESFEYDLFIDTLQTSMVAGTEADMIEMFGSWVCSYAEGGRLAEAPASVMTYEQAQGIFFKAPLDGYYCGGKLYGLPNEFNLENGGVLVNPALFEAHGVAYPPKWATFSDLVADAKQLAEFDGETMTRAGFQYVNWDGLPFAFFAGILQQGGNYMAEDGQHFNFDTPEARAITQLLVDMAQKDQVVDPVIFNGDANPPTDGFFAGNIAISFIGSWAAGEGRISYPDLKFDYVAMPPYFGSENKFAADAGWGKVVSVNSPHQQEAWELAKFMAAEQANALEWNSTTGTIPAVKAIVDNPGALLEKAPWIEPTFALLPHGQYLGNLGDRDRLFYDILYPHLLDAVQGVATVDEAVAAIHEEANAMVDEK